MKNILIIDDVVTLGLMLKTWFTKKGFEVKTCLNISDSKKEISQNPPQLIISDLRLPDGSGLDLLKWVKENHPSIEVIVMTSYAEINSAVECIRAGAYDYIAKPLNPDELLEKINALEKEQPSIAVGNAVRHSVTAKKSPETDYIRGCSLEYKKVYEYVDMIAPTDLSVFIKGESGVGKEHIANLIHEKSKRADKPFIPVDCGTMNKELSASEFFGHIKGSFTGAISNKKGYFAEADGGTLFLDEIGNLSLDTQIQLLRALQERKIKPVGANKEIPVDVRVITATNEDLEKMINTGHFRTDLYHRINQFVINIPTLEKCKDDISLFAHHFLKAANLELDKNIIGFDEKTLKLLLNYNWPGNIRELKNIVYRLAIVSKKPIIESSMLIETAPYIYEYDKTVDSK
ncbi:MAG: sigma-54 dependent transcriptional regulator [Dysgonamonadaceae bacterium]|jgi:two-component system response regulator HydG|nr:sigma-54 dependent transcriptional regulator [Dysgonamonadaceae bacterium]